MGGFQEGGFQIVELAAFSSRGNLLLQGEFLLKIDTSLAIATSGLRTNLLFEKPPPENPPFDFPRNPCDRDPPTRNFKNFKFFKNSLKILNIYF